MKIYYSLLYLKNDSYLFVSLFFLSFPKLLNSGYLLNIKYDKA